MEYSFKDKIYRGDLYGFLLISVGLLPFVVLIGYEILTVSLDNKLALYFILFTSLYCIAIFNHFKFKIIIGNEGLTYETLFRKNKIKFTEIIKIESYAKIDGASNSGISASYRTRLYSSKDFIEINIKRFSRKDLKEISQTLIEQCKNATIDNNTHKMVGGKIPSAFFKHQ